MRKLTKLAALVAGLVAICAITAVAAGWVNEGGAWYYLDKDGDYVTSEWKSDGSNYYYLGEDGEMLTSQLVEDGDKLYYVGADGARVANTWVAVEADDADADLDVDHRWYYFQANGKAYKDKTVTINGQKYHFDQDGKMVFGFVDEKCEIINDYEDMPLRAYYYFGGNDDGAMYTGWLQWTEGFTTTDEYDGLAEIWFWFNTTSAASKRGLKLADGTKKINGLNYLFDENGVMLSEWQSNTLSSVSAASTSKYYSADVDGHLVKGQWIYKVPSAEINPSDNEDETSRWFYANSSGALVENCTKKINGKYYTFDDDAIMKSGLVFMKENTAVEASKTSPTKWMYTTNVAGKKPTELTAKQLMEETEYELFYFSGDEKADGSMKTGTYKIDLDDDTYTFTFDKHGKAIKGIQNNKIYVNGMLLTAGDMRYDKVTFDGKDYIVSSTGTIIKNGKYVKDANDDYWAISKSGEIAKFLDSDDAAKEAKAWASKE